MTAYRVHKDPRRVVIKNTILQGGALIAVRYSGSLRKRRYILDAGTWNQIKGANTLSFSGIYPATNMRLRKEFIAGPNIDSIEVLRVGR